MDNRDLTNIPSFEDFESRRKTNPFGIHINPTRILSNILRYWYFVMGFVFLTVSIAWAINRYTKKLFPVRAEIMIKEASEVQGAEILYNNPLIDPYRNYYNELYYIKSYPIIEKVITQLDLHISFVREGNIKDSEVYGNAPVKVQVLENEYSPSSFFFVMIDERSFSLVPSNDNQETNGKVDVYQFGDTIRCNKIGLVFKPVRNLNTSFHLGREYLLNLQDPHQVASSYINRLEVEWAAQGSSLLNLRINGYTPTKEMDFLQKLIEVYKKNDLDRKNETATRSIKFIQSQLNEIADSLSLFESQLEAFKNENYIADLGSEAQRLFQMLDAAQRKRSELMVRESYYHYLEDYVNQNANLEQIILPSALGIQDGILQALVNRMIDLQLRAKTINRQLESRNPYLGNIEAQVQDIRKNIIESLSGLNQADQFRLQEMDGQISRIENQLKALPRTERELVGIQRNYNLLEGIYIFLLQKLNEARISEAAAISDIVTVNPPRLSGQAIRPQPVQNYAIALVLGLFLPTAFFALKEFFNNRVQSKDDITKVTEIPFLGAIGHNRLETNLVVNSKPRSSMSEAFRSLRSNLNYFVDNKNACKVYMVTSSVSGEGKTFTSINLGTVFAISGKRSLLLGADLRKPRIYDDFDLTNDIGLSNYLSNQASFQDIVQRTTIENLEVVSAGPVPPNPSELLLKDEVATFFHEAVRKYDVIIIDTPPLDIVTDAFSLASYVDHTLFIVRQGFTPLATVQKLSDITNKMPSMSIVLNDILNTRPGYGLGYGYHYGYGYGRYKYGRYYGRGSGYFQRDADPDNGYGYYED